MLLSWQNYPVEFILRTIKFYNTVNFITIFQSGQKVQMDDLRALEFELEKNIFSCLFRCILVSEVLLETQKGKLNYW